MGMCYRISREGMATLLKAGTAEQWFETTTRMEDGVEVTVYVPHWSIQGWEFRDCETAFIGPKEGKSDMEELFDAAGVRYGLA